MQYEFPKEPHCITTPPTFIPEGVPADLTGA